MISYREIIDKFLFFFKQKNHQEIKNSSIIPENDPTLLFINSGMAAIKPYFIGEIIPEHSELCNVQICIRTNDIDSVGDKHHLTSFQMLGNWSINGSYFKEGAINLAYDFLTHHLLIPKEKLYVSVFSGSEELNLDLDVESYDFWKAQGFSKDHIVCLGIDDNFWGPAGDYGPCGPCTEIFYDTGVGTRYESGGFFDTTRYIEIWNAGVFMCLNKTESNKFEKLAFTSVDAGAGVERFAMVLQNHTSVYETDLLAPIKLAIEELFDVFFDFNNIKIEKNEEYVKRIRILTDHLRTISIILATKISPSNEGRGYIPRKLIRKVLSINRQIVKDNSDSLDKNPNLVVIIEFILDNFSDVYKDFSLNKKYVIEIFLYESEKFDLVLKTGMKKLYEIKNHSNVITGEEGFELATTFGLPLDVIKDFSIRNDMEFNEEEFKNKFDEHRNISKKDKNINTSNEILDKIFNTMSTFLCEEKNGRFKKQGKKIEFLGYEENDCNAKILKIFSETGEKLNGISSSVVSREFLEHTNGKLDYSINSEQINHISQEIGNQKKKVFLVFDKTTIYSQSGGQESDFALIIGSDFCLKVINSFKKTIGNEDIFINFCELIYGTIKINDNVYIQIDNYRRAKISRAHSCAHILQSALKEVFGSQVCQKGSKIEEEKIRFDFNYTESISRENFIKIEDIVNEKIALNLNCNVKILKKEHAINSEFTALFTDKYKEDVRCVSIGDYSKELCGGTHVKNTSEIGLFVITSFETIAKGIKRVNCLTGFLAFKFLQDKFNIVFEASKKINSNFEDFLLNLNKKIDSSPRSSKQDTKKIQKSDFVFTNNLFYFFEYDNSKPKPDELLRLANEFNHLILARNKNNGIMLFSPEFSKIDSKLFLKKLIKDFDGCGNGNKNFASGKIEAAKKELVEKISLYLLELTESS